MNDNNLANKKFQRELASGTTSLVILALMARSERPAYGYRIAKMLEAEREDVPVKQGALYPVLRSLEGSGLLDSEVEPSVSGPPRRYYRITAAGRAALSEWSEIWEQTRNFVDTNLKGDKYASRN